MNIIVIGDILLDINYISNIYRNAPEANIPIHNIQETNYILGGAANVANNLKQLNANVKLIGITGNDNYSSIIINLLTNKNIQHKIFVDVCRPTTTKHRIFNNNTLNVRYDIESTNDISFELQQNIINYICNEENIGIIVISDYDKGIITKNLCQTIINYANDKNILTFIDPKLNNYEKYKNCFLFKPNLNEATIISNTNNIETTISTLYNKINCKNLLLTLGNQGMLLNNITNKITHKQNIQAKDVTGAGDIVLALLVYGYIKYNDLYKAAKLANYIAGKSVQHIGNYQLTLKDITDYENNSKIIYDYELDKLTNLSSQNKNIVFTNGCFDILHSAHIELLQFAKKQGDLLVVGLNSDESITLLKGQSRPINNIQERSHILELFDFIDYIIIFNELTPLNIIKQLKPSILVKGSDYNKDNIVGKEFVNEIILFDFITGKSSTNIINNIKNVN